MRATALPGPPPEECDRQQDRERDAEDYFDAMEKLTRPPAVPVVVTATLTVPPRVLTKQSTS